jgi:hypothetical protein
MAEKKKRVRLSTYPKTCQCGVNLENKFMKYNHKCKKEEKEKHSLFDMLQAKNYMEDFKQLKVDIAEDTKIADFISELKDESNEATIKPIDIFAEVPEIFRDGAYIKIDRESKLLYYVALNKRTNSVFQEMLMNDEMEIVKL